METNIGLRQVQCSYFALESNKSVGCIS